MTVKRIQCIDNAAYEAAATRQAGAMRSEALADLAIQVALYVAERTIFGNITDLKKNLADRRLAMARDVVAHQQHARPTEEAFVMEIMNAPKPEPIYNRATEVATEADRFATNARRRIDAELTRLGAGDRGACFDNRTVRSLALAKLDVAAYTMRTEEARANKLSERRVSRQLSVIGMGKGLLIDALRIGQVGEKANAIVAGTILESLNAAGTLFTYVNHTWRKSPGYDAVTSQAPRVVQRGQVLAETTDPRSGGLTYNVMSENAYRAYEQSNIATQGDAQRAVSAQSAADPYAAGADYTLSPRRNTGIGS